MSAFVVACERQFVSVGIATDIFGDEFASAEGVAFLGPQLLESCEILA